MATKVDLGAMINNGFNTGLSILSKLVGSGGSPLNNPVTTSGQVKVGNVGGIFGINLNITTIALIAAGILGVVLIVKKLK
jgi:hypothetical protein